MQNKWRLTSALLTLWNHENAPLFKRDQDIHASLKTIIKVVDTARFHAHRIPSYLE